MDSEYGLDLEQGFQIMSAAAAVRAADLGFDFSVAVSLASEVHELLREAFPEAVGRVDHYMSGPSGRVIEEQYLSAMATALFSVAGVKVIDKVHRRIVIQSN